MMSMEKFTDMKNRISRKQEIVDLNVS
jgi:hypothetical protein